MGSMVAVNGILSMIAEARADTHRITRIAITRDPLDIWLTQSAMIWIRPVSSAPATMMKSNIKKIRVGHSISCSRIPTILTRLITRRIAAPVMAAMLGSM